MRKDLESLKALKQQAFQIDHMNSYRKTIKASTAQPWQEVTISQNIFEIDSTSWGKGYYLFMWGQQCWMPMY